MVPTIQPEPEFSWTCGFCKGLDNVELVMYVKFYWMQGYEKKHQKCPQNGNGDPQDFFQKSSSVTFVPLWCPNFI